MKKTGLDGANIGRLVASVKKQIAAAESLLGNPSAASGAPSRAREAAKLRIRYPEASLNELAKLFDPPVSKSTAYKRLREMEAQASIPQSE
ncbi:MAG: hypothetical protein LBK04_04385 [Clostridiales Family XIII bacterium]|nr:hypothetical protein [Clostridiales Family XIII bacterium]